jgi:hypothetical protein
MTRTAGGDHVVHNARILIVMVLVWPASASRGAHAQSLVTADFGPPRATSNITVTAAFERVVREMLERSPTFRAQWAALAAKSNVRIRLRVETQSRPYRARTLISRYRYGMVIALVELPPYGDHVELIAHELEHVVEQLEGVNLRELATDPTAGVQDLWLGYETMRAHDVGRQVAREYLREPDAIGAAAKRVARWIARMVARPRAMR